MSSTGLRVVRRTTGRALAGGVAALLCLTLAACSGEDDPTPKPTPTPQGPVLLSFSVYGPPPVVTAYAKIAADFSAAHPGVVVNVHPYDNHEQSDDALKKAAAADTEPDIFLAERSDLPYLTEDDRIKPVDQLLSERGVDFGDGFQREALEAFSGDSSLLCMPVDISPLVVYYNTRLVDLAKLTGPGETPVSADSGWNIDEFEKAARQASHGRVRGVYVEPSLEQIAPFVWSGGGHMIDDLDEPTTLTLSDGGSEKALERLLEIVRNPRLTYSDRVLAQVSALDLFKRGRLAMMLGYRSLTPTLRAQSNLDFDVMPVPRQSRRGTVGTMSGLCISGGSEHVDEAAEFIAYAVSDGPTETLAQTGFVTPTNVDVANSDAFLQPGERPANPQVFTRAVRYVQRLPVGEGWEAVERAAAAPLTRLFNDPVIEPLDERLKSIDALSQRLLARYVETTSPSPSPSESPQ